MQVQLIH